VLGQTGWRRCARRVKQPVERHALTSPPDPSAKALPTTLAGVACGIGAALFWAAGFVAGRHGILAGFSPADIAFHRYVWVGLALLPWIARAGLADLGGIGWTRAIALTLFCGPLFSMISYAGFLLVPLGHGGVIQPSCAALGGLLLATLVLHEKLPGQRIAGAAIIVAGLMVIGGEALATIGTHGLLGDFSFAVAGLMYATFGTLLRLWRITPMRAVAATCVVSLVYVPMHWIIFGFERMAALGPGENLLQMAVQGIFSGAGATYLFARAVVLLGAGRAAVFASLVPGFTLLIGAMFGEVPSLLQVVGFVVVLAGFRLTQKG
jgi:drug/metabolite transporter (DMT)-like permease